MGFYLLIVGSVLASGIGVMPSMAQRSDSWGFGGDFFKTLPSRVALVADKGRLGESGEVMLGVVVNLAEGWKTYWRNPGDSGIPPIFDWSSSNNMEVTEMLWPAPERFDLPDDSSFGYKNEVLFPVRVVAPDINEPMDVALTLSYGVCREVCVPLEDKARLSIPPGPPNSSMAAADIQTALRLVPGEKDTTSGLVLDYVGLKPKGNALAIGLQSEGGVDVGPYHLVVEAVDIPSVYFGVPVVEAQEQDKVQFRIPVDRSEGATSLEGKTITITVREGRRALSETVQVGYSQANE
ncbi:MAG: protein-disulfide reductase DsbD domain-containing protein [Parvularculales bacterium]